MRHKNKEEVPSKNTFKVGMLGKIEEKVKRKGLGEAMEEPGGGWLKRYPKGKNLSRNACMDPSEILLGAVWDG